MQFVEILEQQADVIHHVGALRMARQQRALPGAHVLVKFVTQLSDFAAQAVQILGRNFRPRETPQVGDFPLQPFDFLFPRIFFMAFSDAGF